MLIASVITETRCTARRNRNPGYMSDARDAVYKKNPRDEKKSRRFKASRRHKPSRLQGVGLPGGPEEHVGVGSAVPVVDAHDTPADVEYGAAAIREHFGTGA